METRVWSVDISHSIYAIHSLFLGGHLYRLPQLYGTQLPCESCLQMSESASSMMRISSQAKLLVLFVPLSLRQESGSARARRWRCSRSIPGRAAFKSAECKLKSPNWSETAKPDINGAISGRTALTKSACLGSWPT